MLLKDLMLRFLDFSEVSASLHCLRYNAPLFTPPPSILPARVMYFVCFCMSDLHLSALSVRPCFRIVFTVRSVVAMLDILKTFPPPLFMPLNDLQTPSSPIFF